MKSIALTLLISSTLTACFAQSGMKISQYPQTNGLNPDDLFLVTLAGVTNKTIAASHLPGALGVPLSAQVQPASANLSNAASATANGYLTSSHWNIFNSKGTVSSVGLTLPGVLFNSSVPGSPVTGSGTLAPTLQNQSANTFLAGPSSGGATTPTFRGLTGNDLHTVVTATSASSTTMYTLTTTSTNVLGANQVTLPSPGTYLLIGSVTLNVVPLFPDDPTVTVTFQRTNNTATALGSSRSVTISNYSFNSSGPGYTTISVIALPALVYTTANSGDVISIYGKYAGAASSSYLINDGSIAALRIY